MEGVSVSSIPTALSRVSLKNGLSVAVAGKAKNVQKQQGDAALKLLETAAQVQKSRVDLYG